jgi:hypothetical protein
MTTSSDIELLGFYPESRTYSLLVQKDIGTIDIQTRATYKGNSIVRSWKLVIQEYIPPIFETKGATEVSFTHKDISYRGYLFDTTSNGSIKLCTFGSTIDIYKDKCAYIDVLIVGGGGGGAGGTIDFQGGGGGGAGGIVFVGQYKLTETDVVYPVSVGIGGSGGLGGQGKEGIGTNGSQGGSSSIFGYTAIGGGFGVAGRTKMSGGNGGSGGGGYTPGVSIDSQGYNGGKHHAQGFGAGGGGGFISMGGDGSIQEGGYGGQGYDDLDGFSNITLSLGHGGSGGGEYCGITRTGYGNGGHGGSARFESGLDGMSGRNGLVIIRYTVDRDTPISKLTE